MEADDGVEIWVVTVLVDRQPELRISVPKAEGVEEEQITKAQEWAEKNASQ